MSTAREYQYHIERARAEMDCAYRAGSHEAVSAHMRLSALHMERARLARAGLRADVRVRPAGLGQGR
ncbi:MAG TPA: hypothetical protein VF582_04710 [Allosphingosinicella sp.]